MKEITMTKTAEQTMTKLVNALWEAWEEAVNNVDTLNAETDVLNYLTKERENIIDELATDFQDNDVNETVKKLAEKALDTANANEFQRHRMTLNGYYTYGWTFEEVWDCYINEFIEG